MFRIITVAVALLALLTACTTDTKSNPPRTATEQLLISTAAERAAGRLALELPPNAAVFVDNTNFEGYDSKDAIAAIHTALLKQGMRLIDDKKKADIIVETRAGALSTDQHSFLIGVPQFNVPVPFASTPIALPQIALYATADQKGVAKFAITGYDAKKGTLIAAQDPQYGFAHNKETTVLIFISWQENSALPEDAEAVDTVDQKQPRSVSPSLSASTPH